MMGRIAGVVWRKEIRDAARDPRALFYLVGLPLVFYPSLLLALEFLAQHMVGDVRPTPHRVAVANIEEAAGLARLLDRTEDLVVVESANPPLAVVQGQAHLGLEPLSGFDAALARGLAPRIDLYVNLALPGGADARQRVLDLLTEYEASLPPATTRGRAASTFTEGRFLVGEAVLVQPTEDLGFMVGLFPYFLVVLVLVGAAHMAIDITSGEKERRTLETLLVSPADRHQILMGKITATVTAAAAAGTLGMVGFAGAVELADLMSDGHPQLLSLPPGAFWIMGLGSLPAAFFLSALLVSLGVFARSSREGQTYTAYLQMPLLILALGAGYISLDSHAAYYMVPLLGTNLVQRAYLMGEGDVGHAILAAGTTLLLGVILAALAGRLFSRESTLFRM